MHVHTQIHLVQVLTMQQYEDMLEPEPPKPTQLAKALFDFQGQSYRELSFEKVITCLT